MEEHDGRVAAEGGRLVLVVRHVARGQDVLAGAVRRFMYFVIICCVVKIQSAHVVHSSEHWIRPVHFRLEKVRIVDTSDNFR